MLFTASRKYKIPLTITIARSTARRVPLKNCRYQREESNNKNLKINKASNYHNDNLRLQKVGYCEVSLREKQMNIFANA